MAYGGAQTELYSEILAQVCLAFSMINRKALTGEDLNEKTIISLKPYVITHSKGNLNSKTFIQELIDFGNYPISKGFTWVDGQGRAMAAVRNTFIINSTYKIYNDKLYGNTPSNMNPYSAFIKARTGAKPDKWNPADMWVMNRQGIKALNEVNRKVRSRTKVSLQYVNQFLMDQFSARNIIPVSLKKPRKTPHLDIVNSNEYITRLSLNRTSNPTIEYTLGNKDVKINFTIETLQLAPGQKAATARRNPASARGTVVRGSEKHIRLKYHVDNKKIEIEYDQSGRSVTKTAEAKMGNLGAGGFQNIINKTSRSGVNKLNTIQRRYSDIGINQDPWFNSRQLHNVWPEDAKDKKPRRAMMELEPYYVRMAEYVEEIWKEISGSAPDFRRDTKAQLHETWGLWSKARAGELGVAVGSIGNERTKQKVIENLYQAAASISYAVGMTAGEEELMEPSTRQVVFNSGVYVKVY